ncbi:MAG: BlaI/MecI/CopY family transcriptional regulator [Thermoguttaceae bacterium]
MRREKNLMDLARRQRQIVEAVYRLEEASVADVLAELADPPSYSAVRAILTSLVQKGVLAYRHEGKRYLYRGLASKEKVQQSVLSRMVSTLFGDRPSVALAALLDVAGDRLTDAELDEMRKLIDQSRKENS